jgi:hypothetical protein
LAEAVGPAYTRLLQPHPTITLNSHTHPVRIARKRAPHALILLTALATALSACGSSAAATPCWKQVLSDWSHHHLGKTTYAISCYDQAIAHLPPDVRYYSDAPDAIHAAKLAAINKTEKPRKVAGLGAGGSQGGGSGPTGGSSDGNGGTPASPLSKVLGSSSADTVPLPLIIVAGLAILLLAAGAVGIANRHVQARRVTDDPPA